MEGKYRNEYVEADLLICRLGVQTTEVFKANKYVQLIAINRPLCTICVLLKKPKKKENLLKN